MSPAEVGLWIAGQNLVQSGAVSVLLWLSFARSGHGAQWLLFALLPMAGLVVSTEATLLLGALVPPTGPLGALPYAAVPSAIAFAAVAAPLAVLGWRLGRSAGPAPGSRA